MRVNEEIAGKLPKNGVGLFYVSDECDGCAYCGMVAPDNFEYDKSSNSYYVIRQPESPEEMELVLEAMEDCPIDAIRRNGR
jgi:ferredoxin